MQRLFSRFPPRFSVLIVLLLGGCVTLVAHRLDERYGAPDPARFDRPQTPVAGAPDYWGDVRPILDQRCVVCHACYDAPCQFNATSYAGITRGASPAVVYSAARLRAAEPTRLGFDALTNAEWRSKGFYPMLNERAQTAEANREGSAMYQLLALKQRNPGPQGGPLTERDIDVGLDREQSCAPVEGFEQYAQRHPQRGMPFGLPPLSANEHQILTRWIEAGAPYRPLPPLSRAASARVAEWERFLNGDTMKEQLTARYIYEHWYVGQLHFEEAPGRYFELVRSRTPPGKPIDVVATRRPYDDPGVARVYYRLREMEATQIAKKFMPLKLDTARLARVRGWFAKAPYQVTQLPSYEPEKASNPFVTFAALPVDSRYRFMLDDAQFILMGFMKGPVCRGQVALNVISDYFWVLFVSPDSPLTRATHLLLEADAPNLQLPAAEESQAGLLAWRQYAELEKRHMVTRGKALEKIAARHQQTLADIWDGDGRNPDAALTVFRHFDSASVIRGLAGPKPQTTLVLSYPLLERMHYLLLTGFDVFGNVGHQLATRLYMDFLRMEGELNFVALLPIAQRKAVLDQWYRDSSETHKGFLAEAAVLNNAETGVRYREGDALTELYRMLSQRVAAVRDPALDWKAQSGLEGREIAQVRRLAEVQGIPASHMPEHSVLVVRRADGGMRIVSLIRNSAHSNVAHIMREDKRRLPAEDTLLPIAGMAGNYPNAYYVVTPEQLPEFVDAVGRLKQPSDLTRLTDRFGVRRTEARFWPLSDAVHAEWRRIAPTEAAILDYSRLENN